MTTIETFLSKPALLVDLPEPESISSEFIYNFFTADERINESGDAYNGGVSFTTTTVDLGTETYTTNIATSDITNSNLKKFYGRNAIQPRFNKIVITKPRTSTTENLRLDTSDITSIAREIALNVFGRVGVTIADTSLDQTVYNLLSGSSDQIMSNDTSDVSSRLMDAIVNSIQPDGYRYAATDARRGAINPIVESLAGLDYGFSYLANIAGTITAAALNSTKNIYADETSSTLAELTNIQQQAVASSSPYVLRSSDYEADFNFIDKPVRLSSGETSPEKLENILIGYVIQKFGTSLDGTTTIADEKLVLNPNTTSFLDANVAYGKRYKYRVSALYACMFQFNQQTGTGGSVEESRVVTKYSIFSSRGIDTAVLCEEEITPPPPVDLGFRYKGDNTGLIITWNFPINLQSDIKKFQVFRRASTSEPFKLIRMYDFDDSVVKSNDAEGVPERLITRSLLPTTIHKDTEFTKNSRFIYAICAIDAHGYTSNYSVQLEASYDRYRNRINTRVISRSDAPKPYPNIFVDRDTFIDTMKMSGYTRLNIYFDPEYIDVTDKDGVSQHHVITTSTRSDDNLYKMMIVNTDFQQSQTLDIKIDDSYVQPPVITPSRARVFSPT
jgi:hypothetical protein